MLDVDDLTKVLAEVMTNILHVRHSEGNVVVEAITNNLNVRHSEGNVLNNEAVLSSWSRPMILARRTVLMAKGS